MMIAGPATLDLDRSSIPTASAQPVDGDKDHHKLPPAKSTLYCFRVVYAR